MDDNCVLIITGGNLNQSLIKDFFNQHVVETVICVDGALALCDQMNLSIDYLVGDYDTVSKDLIEEYQKRVQAGEIKTKILSFQPEKDETDTQIAISLALQLGANEIYLMGATGTRLDHVLANIQLLKKPLEEKVDAYILDEHNRIYLRDCSFEIHKDKMYGPYFSLIPFGNKVEAVTLTGFKYNTDSIDFLQGNSLGVSNELLGEIGTITFQEGTFVVIESND